MVIFSLQPQNRRFSYSLSGKDSTYFEINPSSGLLKINATLDYEQEKFNYSFEVSKESLSVQNCNFNLSIWKYFFVFFN